MATVASAIYNSMLATALCIHLSVHCLYVRAFCFMDSFALTQTCMGDPCDIQRRRVVCSDRNSICDVHNKPPTRRQCSPHVTCGKWLPRSWSKVRMASPCLHDNLAFFVSLLLLFEWIHPAEPRDIYAPYVLIIYMAYVFL